MAVKEPLIPKHGGYRNLKSFQISRLAYDVTTRFCNRYIEKRSRTHDQMVQAARSGVQNIAEGSQASGTSRKFEIKLTNVARASLEELKLDYEDYLRQRGKAIWPRENPLRQQLIDRRCSTVDEVALWIKEVHDRGVLGGPCGQGGRGGQCPSKQCQSQGQNQGQKQAAPSTASTLSTRSTGFTRLTYPEIAANAALVLIAVACSLLDRQIATLAEAFEKEGGFTERLYRVRTANRKNRPW